MSALLCSPSVKSKADAGGGVGPAWVFTMYICEVTTKSAKMAAIFLSSRADKENSTEQVQDVAA